MRVRGVVNGEGTSFEREARATLVARAGGLLGSLHDVRRMSLPYLHLELFQYKIHASTVLPSLLMGHPSTFSLRKSFMGRPLCGGTADLSALQIARCLKTSDRCMHNPAFGQSREEDPHRVSNSSRICEKVIYSRNNMCDLGKEVYVLGCS